MTGVNVCPECTRSLANVDVCDCGYTPGPPPPRPEAMQEALEKARAIGARTRKGGKR